jgi:transcription termination factor NusB
MKNKRKNVRETALEILETIEKNQSYSNLLLNNAINKNEIDKKDIGLLTELTYGTLQRKMTLDYFLSPFLTKNKKMESWVRQLLRLTLYQMVYLDKIPDRAAIFEAVEIAKRLGHKGIYPGRASGSGVAFPFPREASVEAPVICPAPRVAPMPHGKAEPSVREHKCGVNQLPARLLGGMAVAA